MDIYFQPKDLDAVESQRLERIQAARRIRRSKSAPSSGRSSSVSDSSKGGGGGGGGGGNEDSGKSTCLPNIFKMQQKSSDKHSTHKDLHQQQPTQQDHISPPLSPDSNPPSYNEALERFNHNTDKDIIEEGNENSNNKQCNNNEDCPEAKDESTTPLLIHHQNQR